MWQNSKKSDIVAALFFTAIGIAVCVAGKRYGIGEISKPAPGFFPFWSGVLLLAVAGVLFYQSLRGTSSGSQPFGNLWRLGILWGALIAYVLLLDAVGYLIVTALLSLACLQLIEIEKSWWKSALISVALALGSYLLFDRLLMVTLPAGVLANFL
jgi:putative tricarboxylic transport membrane protein